MKTPLFLFLMMTATWVQAAESEQQWHESALSDEVIHKIQQAQYTYKKCVSDAMRKPEAAALDSRHGTDAVIRACEPVLGDIRKVYLDNNVPPTVADHHLKKMRIQVTRNVLQELMYAEAAKKAGQQP